MSAPATIDALYPSVDAFREAQDQHLAKEQLAVRPSKPLPVGSFTHVFVRIGDSQPTAVRGQVVATSPEGELLLGLDSEVAFALRRLGALALVHPRSRRSTIRLGGAGHVDRADDEVLLEAGTVLEGRFRIEGHLGTGGMGQVYRAMHVHLKRPVALKLLRKHSASDPESWRRFEREAQLVSQLESPHIVRVFDFGKTAEGQAFLAMEYVEGGTLDLVIAEGPLAPARVVELIAQICEGLQEAHHFGIIHRDLKPANLVLGRRRDGSEIAKILDFGIAVGPSTKDPSGDVTHSTSAMGTPMYLAPEQALNGEVDARTDLYALGCVTYELLTGHPPFVAPELATIISMQVTQAPPPMTLTRPELASLPGVNAAVMKVLAKTRAERFSTAAEFASALREGLLVRTSRLTLSPGLRQHDLVPRHRPLPGRRALEHSIYRQMMDSQQLVVDGHLVNEWAMAREGFIPRGDKVAMLVVEASEPSDGRWPLTAMVLAARAFGGVVDSVSQGCATLLFSGPSPEVASRVALAAIAAEEAAQIEAARRNGRVFVRCAAIELPKTIDLRAPTEPAVVATCRAALSRRAGGWVAISRSLADELTDLIELEPVDDEISRVVARRSRLRADAPRALFGRAVLLAKASARLAGLSTGQTAPLVFKGGRGSGRTALLLECATRARAAGARVGLVLGSDATRETPFGAILELLSSLLGHERQLSGPRLAEVLGTAGLDPADIAAAAALAQGSPSMPAFTPGQAARVVRCVCAAVTSGPVALFFDDLDRLDHASFETFRELVGWPADREWTVGAASLDVPAVRLEPAEVIELPAFTRGDVAQWLSSQLEHPPVASVTERFFALTSGQPGRLVDWLQVLHDRGSLRVAGGVTTLVGTVSQLDADGLVDARLEAAPPAMRWLLEAVAVCGDSCTPDDVTAVLPGVRPEFFATALAARWLKVLPGHRFGFTSRRIRGRVLATPSSGRALLHQRLVAPLVEQARGNPAEVDSFQLARHLNEAGQGSKAAGLWQHLAADAVSRASAREAVSALKGWADALAQGPTTDEVLRARVRLLARAAGLALSIQDPALARTLVDAGLEVQSDVPASSAELELSLARVLRSEARPQRAAEALERARRSAEGTGLQALVDAESAEVCEQANDVRAAMLAWERTAAAAARATECARWHGEPALAARVAGRMGALQAALEDFGAAQALLRRSLEGWQQAGWAAGEARAWSNLGSLAAQTQNFVDAAQCFESASVVAHRAGDLLFEARMRLQQARVVARLGHDPKALLTVAAALCASVGWEEGLQAARPGS